MANAAQRLADAGLVEVDTLSQDDLQLIAQLSDEEVTVLIQVATRLYPDDKKLVKLPYLHHGGVRLMVPL